MASWSANIQAQINSVQMYQQETFSFTKYCEHYIVGYSTYGVQIIKGRCHYGGIRDLGVIVTGQNPTDLPAYIKGFTYADLMAEIFAEHAIGTSDLGGISGGHLPIDISAYIDTHGPDNLLAYIRGFDYRDLSAYMGVFKPTDLPAVLYVIPPSDLPAYLKVWPQENLPGTLRGWQEAYLGAYINAPETIQLQGIIGAHRSRNLKVILKGWAREVSYDLGAALTGFGTSDLSGYVRAREFTDISAYLYAIPPRNLQGLIHGWQEANLSAIIIGDDYPWNLPAYINVIDGKVNLLASIIGKRAVASPRDLNAYILVTQGFVNLSASLNIKQASDLTAYIDTGKGVSNIAALIYPKLIKLTGVLSIVTMEHRDLSATISIPCFYSAFSDLLTYLRPVFQKNLGAFIYPKDFVWGVKDLGASFGYAPNTVVQDKLTINLNISSLGFRTEDKLNINLKLYLRGDNLGAYIIGQRRPADLSAYINALEIIPYNFETWKGKERVYDKTYTQVIRDYEDVDISFETIVKDYFYSSGSDVVAKVDRYTHFVTKVASYYSPSTSRRLDRKLHKVKYLYDLRKFNSVDEAMRYAIYYVTLYPKCDLPAYINSVAFRDNKDLMARIGTTRYYSNNTNLTSTVNGMTTHSYDVIIGFTDDGVGFLNF
jgi:hypothetical protein